MHSTLVQTPFNIYVNKNYTNESSKSSNKCECSKSRSKELQFTDLYNSRRSDGTPCGQKSSKHHGHDDKCPIIIAEWHCQWGNTSNPYLTFLIKIIFQKIILPSAINVTTRALTPGKSVNIPDRILPIVLQMPTIEMRKDALSSETPLSMASFGRNV